ncbi:MAG: ABC transporter substrate-binding protein, partial [Acutalibacteraceae bacterium]
MKKIKSVLAIITAGILSLSMAGCGKTQENAAAEAEEESLVIRVSNVTTSQYAVELAIAEKKGFFDEAFAGKNVTIEYATFGTGPAIMEAMAAGELDFAHGVGDQPTLSSIVNGSGGVIVARTVLNATGNGIFVDYDSDIASVEDLKGKVIAVNLGSAGQKGLDLILEDHGLSENDVELLNLKNIDEIFAAFEKNEIDAAVSAQMALSEQKALDGKIAKKLVDFSSHPNYAYLTVKSDFAQAHPEETQAFIDALYKAGQWYNENIEEGDQLVAEFLDADINDVVIANASSEIYIDFNEDDIQNIQ